jgi:hypothetical protein
MNTAPTDEVVLKTDALGRVKTPAARREQLLDEFERSGMSGVQFAQFVGVKYQTFATWAQHRRRRRKTAARTQPPLLTAAPKQLRWMEAVIAPARAPEQQDQAALVLQLPGGVRVEITEAKQVALAAALVRALGQPSLPC